jgi:hypothetical protein
MASRDTMEKTTGRLVKNWIVIASPLNSTHRLWNRSLFNGITKTKSAKPMRIMNQISQVAICAKTVEYFDIYYSLI